MTRATAFHGENREASKGAMTDPEGRLPALFRRFLSLRGNVRYVSRRSKRDLSKKGLIQERQAPRTTIAVARRRRQGMPIPIAPSVPARLWIATTLAVLTIHRTKERRECRRDRSYRRRGEIADSPDCLTGRVASSEQGIGGGRENRAQRRIAPLDDDAKRRRRTAKGRPSSDAERASGCETASILRRRRRPARSSA